MENHELSAKQATIIEKSFASILTRGDYFADCLYRHLFSLDPETKKLFLGDQDRQRSMLMVLLSTVVRSASNLETMRPQLEALGKRHETYGVKKPHFTAFKFAVMKSLAEVLLDEFEPESADAWSHFFDLVVRAMYPDNPASPS